MWLVPIKLYYVHVLNYSLISCSKVLSDHIIYGRISASYFLHFGSTSIVWLVNGRNKNIEGTNGGKEQYRII